MEKRLFYTPLLGLALLCISGFFAFSILLTGWLNDYSSKALASDLSRIIKTMQQQAPENTPQYLTDYLSQLRVSNP